MAIIVLKENKAGEGEWGITQRGSILNHEVRKKYWKSESSETAYEKKGSLSLEWFGRAVFCPAKGAEMPRARGGEGSCATELSLDGAAYTAVQHFLDEMENHHMVLDKAEGTHDLSFLLKKKKQNYICLSAGLRVDAKGSKYWSRKRPEAVELTQVGPGDAWTWVVK